MTKIQLIGSSFGNGKARVAGPCRYEPAASALPLTNYVAERPKWQRYCIAIALSEISLRHQAPSQRMHLTAR